ncbi:MAG: hypothetical protein MI861_07400, partial [Pirellulales bacterium]|nr:hypothetical protein [Pirellulales bacterium]
MEGFLSRPSATNDEEMAAMLTALKASRSTTNATLGQHISHPSVKSIDRFQTDRPARVLILT